MKKERMDKTMNLFVAAFVGQRHGFLVIIIDLIFLQNNATVFHFLFSTYKDRTI